MTLATRVIGTILYDGGSGLMVHRVNFRTERSRGSPLSQAQVYVSREMDEIVLLDVTATEQGREPDYDLIAQIAETCRVPLAYGGGVSSVDIAARVIGTGADKVVIGTGAVRFPDWDMGLITAIADRFGRQAAVVSLDVRYIGVHGRPEIERLPEFMLRSGQMLPGLLAVDFATFVEMAGAGEILLQSIEHDGTLSGYNLGLIEAVSKVVSIPVIASSGCGKPSDMVEAMKAGASAVAAGWMWDATGTTPYDCKIALHEAGYPVRLSSREALRA